MSDVTGLKTHENTMLTTVTPRATQKLMKLTLHDLNRVLAVGSTLPSFHFKTPHTYIAAAPKVRIIPTYVDQAINDCVNHPAI